MIESERIAALAEIVGPDGLLTSGDDLARFETDARDGSRGRAAFVVLPRSTEQVSRIVAHCVRHGIALVAQSGNTGLVGASVPDKSGDQGVISFARLTGELAIDAANRTVRVGAGVRLSALNEALAAYDLTLPIDLGADPCVGGMVASNTGGARFLRYGDVRKHVLGLEAVLLDADGTVLDMMSALRKNNTGLDAKQIFVGTGGRFGFVTAAILEVHRRPQASAAALLVPRDAAAAIELLGLFEAQAGAELTAFEGMSRNAVSAALDHVKSLRNPFGQDGIPEFSILVELMRTRPDEAGERTLDERLVAILENAWQAPGEPLVNAIVGAPAELWKLRHSLTEGLRARGRVIAFDVAFARGDVMTFRAQLAGELALRHPALEVCDFGHIGDGGLHFNLVEPRGTATPLAPAQIDALRDFVVGRVVDGFGGSFSAEHGIGPKNRVFFERHVGATARRVGDGIGTALAGLSGGGRRVA